MRKGATVTVTGHAATTTFKGIYVAFCKAAEEEPGADAVRRWRGHDRFDRRIAVGLLEPSAVRARARGPVRTRRLVLDDVARERERSTRRSTVARCSAPSSTRNDHTRSTDRRRTSSCPVTFPGASSCPARPRVHRGVDGDGSGAAVPIAHRRRRASSPAAAVGIFMVARRRRTRTGPGCRRAGVARRDDAVAPQAFSPASWRSAPAAPVAWTARRAEPRGPGARRLHGPSRWCRSRDEPGPDAAGHGRVGGRLDGDRDGRQPDRHASGSTSARSSTPLGLGDNVVGRDVSTTFDEAEKVPLVTRRARRLGRGRAVARADAGARGHRVRARPRRSTQIRAAGIPVVVFPRANRVSEITSRHRAGRRGARSARRGTRARRAHRRPRSAAVQATIPADGEDDRASRSSTCGARRRVPARRPGSGAGLDDRGGRRRRRRDGDRARPAVHADHERGARGGGAGRDPDDDERAGVGRRRAGPGRRSPASRQTPAGERRRIITEEDGLLYGFGAAHAGRAARARARDLTERSGGRTVTDRPRGAPGRGRTAPGRRERDRRPGRPPRHGPARSHAVRPRRPRRSLLVVAGVRSPARSGRTTSRSARSSPRCCSASGSTSATLRPRVGEQVLWEIRFPRVVLTMLVGGSLACAGALMQGTFRNPLADPGHHRHLVRRRARRGHRDRARHLVVRHLEHHRSPRSSAAWSRSRSSTPRPDPAAAPRSSP